MRRTLRLTRALVDKIPATIPDPGPVPEIADLQTDEARARMTANRSPSTSTSGISGRELYSDDITAP